MDEKSRAYPIVTEDHRVAYVPHELLLSAELESVDIFPKSNTPYLAATVAFCEKHDIEIIGTVRDIIDV